MQKIATKVFMISSIVFAFLGIAVVLFTSDSNGGILNEILIKSLFVTVCIILSSFALSVATKYLKY